MDQPADRRSGFTLIEVLIGMVLGGIVISVLFQVIASEGRFVQVQSAREEVQQNTRAALDLISSELRTLPRGAALVTAEEGEITLRTPRMWGTICGIAGATSLNLALPSIAGASFTTNSGTGLTVNFGTVAAPIWSTNSVTVSSISAASATCAGSALATGVESRTVTLSAAPQNGALALAAGQIVYLYDQVSYKSANSSGLGWWVHRKIGDGIYQPMAGPIRDGSQGLRFSYYSEASAAPIATPISDAAVRESVTRVRVIIDAIGRNATGTHRAEKVDTMLVSLRNRGA